MADIEKRVKEIIAEQLKVDDVANVTNEASFIDDLGADSLDTVQLIIELESEFDIEILHEEYTKIKTVQDAIDFIKANAK